MMDRVESISHMREKRSVRKRAESAYCPTGHELRSCRIVFESVQMLGVAPPPLPSRHPARAHSRRAADAATRHSYCAVPIVCAATCAERLRYTLNESKYRIHDHLRQRTHAHGDRGIEAPRICAFPCADIDILRRSGGILENAYAEYLRFRAERTCRGEVT